MHKWVVCCVALAAASASAAVPSMERDALIALYQSTNGSQWNEQANWLGAAGTECTWLGVTCNEAQTAVLRLELADNNLAGTLPPAVGQFLQIEILDLTGNHLTGSLAPVTSLTSLRELWLAVNEFGGPIPTELRALRNLEALNLGINTFSGAIPNELSELTRLQVLGLYLNELTGPVPSWLGSLSDMQYLVVWGNEFSGPIPAELGQLQKLVWLELSMNQLSGPPPATLGQLTNLELLGLSTNRLTGPIPDWVGGLWKLTSLTLDDNVFTGPVPDSLWNLTSLEVLSFGLNNLTGSLSPAVGNLRGLQLLAFHFTSMSGPLPREIGELRELQALFASGTGLTGPIPPEIGNLSHLETLSLWDNNLEGSIPREIGNLVNLTSLDLPSNRLTGPIPPEIGNLVNLTELKIHENALRGPIPREITRLTSLRDEGGLWTDSNALVIDDPDVRAFMIQKDLFGDQGIQTTTPQNVHVIGTTDRSAELGWEEINHYGPGGYQIIARPAGGGPVVAVSTTEYIFEETGVIRGLLPGTTYSFTVAAITYPSYSQKNLIVSDPSPAVTATTGPRVLAPPDVQVTQQPAGLIQINGVPRNEDSFTLTNVGDMATTVTLDIELDFATFEPTQFTLAGGASQTVIIRSIPKPPDYYYGFVWTQGEGAVNLIGISLLSTTPPAGTARAEAVESRVELAGEPGSDSIGQARFRNVGDSMLTGILVSDQPWVVPDDSVVFISPGLTGAVTFRVVRSARPPDVEGALVANLSLIYVDGDSLGFSHSAGDPPTGISVTKVTVVDVSKPATASSTIPGSSGVTYFLPGISAFTRAGMSFFSDVSLLNSSTGGAVGDLRLYYTAAVTQQTTVATLNPIPATNSVTLANIVSTVYGAQAGAGTLQVRTPNWQDIVVQARLLGLSENGSVAGEVPVFRSDRSILADQKLYLTGIEKSATVRSDLYLQETSGAEASVAVDFVNAAGVLTGPRQELSIAAWGLIELPDRVPVGAVTAIVHNNGPGQIAAYARVSDETTGNHWSVVDWSRVHGFRLGETLRIPFVDGRVQSTGGGRRRAVAHGASTAGTTAFSLFNPSAAEVVARMELVDANGTVRHREDIIVAPGHTRTIPNAGAQAQTRTAHAVITPLRRGELVLSARSTRTGVPVIPAASGLRLGQSRIFSNLQDSTAATVTASLPGTFRTSIGLVETAGAAATVRARIFLDEGRALATSIIYRDFTLAPGQQLVVDDLVRAIIGPSRETNLGELHNVQLRIEVASGSGSVVPFVIITDNATGDSLLRME